MNDRSRVRMNCEQVEVLIGARLDGSLEQHDRLDMDAHVAGCSECRVMLSDVERLVADARVLPPITSSRDLWRGIEARLGAQDVDVAQDTQSLEEYRNRTQVARRSVSYRMLAAAAVLLIAVTAGVTWNLARVSDASIGAVLPVASNELPAPDTAQDTVRQTQQVEQRVVASVPTVSRVVPGNRSGDARVVPDSLDLRRAALEARYVARTADELDAIYEREIAALRTIVNERFTELDSTTVAELRKNLDIIDRAIIDSRAALRRDPRSSLLSRQLDRAIEHKMELLRRVALL